MTPFDVATTIPDLPPGFVARDNFNMTIDGMLGGDVQAVIVKGHAGAGKRTLLNSYVRSRPNSTISVFLRPVRLSYEPATVISELATQARALLGAVSPHSDEATTRAAWSALVQRLAERLRAAQRRITIVVDGLSDVCARDESAARELLELIPQRPAFQLLFSGNVDRLLTDVGCSFRPYQLTLFSIGEARQLFEGTGLSESALTKAHTACGGIVGHLAAVRRLITSGLDIDEVLEKQPGELASTMLMEWERADELTTTFVGAAAVIAFDARRHNVATLAQLTAAQEHPLAAALSNATFLTRASDGTYDFISDAFRRFAQRKLETLRQPTLERLIANLLQQLGTRDAVTVLPLLMTEAKQYQDVIDLMSPHYFAELVSVTDSVGAIAVQAAMAARAATTVADEVALIRFSLLQALTADVQRSHARDAEVRALIAVGHSQAALAIARAAAFREERLRLLATVLAGITERGETLERGLTDELKELCTSVSVESLRDDVIEVATDVFSVDPELAIQLVERFGKATHRAHALDWIIAVVSMRHAVKTKKAELSGARLERVYERIEDPQLRSLSQGLGLLAGHHDSDWILNRCQQIPNPIDRLTVLRTWLDLNRRAAHAPVVASKALDTAIKTSDYSVTVPILRQFAAPLPYCKDPALAAELVGRVDSLLAAVPHRSPSVEYTRLQLLLARSQAVLAPEMARLRVLELYIFVSEVSDLAVKAQCLARLYAQLPQIEPTGEHADIRDELTECVRRVLSHSADHTDVMLPILRPLVASHPVYAFGLVDDLNTDVRRDHVRSELTIEFARDDAVTRQTELLLSQVELIADQVLAGSTVVGVLAASRRSSSRSQVLARALWDTLRRFVQPEQRATAATYIARAMSSTADFESAIGLLERSLAEIAVPERRARAAFLAASELATVDPAKANLLLESAAKHEATQGLTGGAGSATYHVLRLAARALRGVFSGGRDASDELQQISDIALLIPDVVRRVVIFSELCHYAHVDDRRDVADMIFTKFLSRAMAEAKDQSVDAHWRSLASAGWALFVRHERGFIAELNAVPSRERERIVHSTIRTIVDGVPPGEPCQSDVDSRRLLSHKDCTDLLVLVDLVSDDHMLFHAVRAISRSAIRRDTLLTREQRASLHEQLSDLVATRLPMRNKIRHEGYRWACAAELLRMEGNQSEAHWRELVGYAAAIPNIPDAAYTLTLVAAAMAAQLQETRRDAIGRALALARSIEVTSERCDCLINIADEVRAWDSRSAEEALREGATLNRTHIEDVDREERIDRLLDIAYQISPDVALALSTELDSDPARGQARQERSSQRLIEARRHMTDESVDGAELAREDGQTLADAAWRNLAALNANTLTPKSPAVIRESLTVAAGHQLAAIYPVFAWAVQNAVDRSAPKTQRAATLRGMSQSIILVAEVVRAIFKDNKTKRSAGLAVPIEPSSVTIVRAGERQKAVDVINHWCQRVQPKYIKICDQYFGPEDFDMLKPVLEHCPDCRVQIMTSLMRIKQLRIDTDPASAFQKGWSQISVEPPPDTDITIVNVTPTGRSPIHDRWWIADGSALDFGTSMNGVGRTQDSKVTECDALAAGKLEDDLDKYLLRNVRWGDTGKILYVTFSL